MDITVSDFMKERYNLMIYLGIDIAKLNHFASAISSDGEILIEPFKFTNDYDGFYLLLSKLAPLDQNSIIIGLESTAHYGNNLVHFLINKDFNVCVLNLFRLHLCVRIISAKRRLIKSTPLLLLKPS